MLRPGTDADFNKADSIHQFSVKNSSGEFVKLNVYKGHVCIIVNVSSRCSLAKSNYKQFNELIENYGDSKGLRILAFPCSQFSGNDELENPKYDLNFDMFDKIDVNGEQASPLWKFLKLCQGGSNGAFIQWNFTKFIINKNGVPMERHEFNVEPLQLVENLSNYW